jgi:peptidoglycan hydrolase-like protein with peptidoglycan-binding domain
MTTIAKDFASKAAVAFVAVAMIFTMFAPAAQAQSSEDLQAMINTLLAQIAALQAQAGQGATTASGVCPYTWTRDLNVGAQGADVKMLQMFLNSNADTRVAATGAGSAGMETEFYGPATAAAVSKMQVMYRADVLTPAGLVNPTGYFGPSTRAKANSLCVAAPVTDGGETDGETDGGTDGEALQGGEGDIEVDVLLDGAADIDLGESEEVVSFEVEAVDSDVSVNRVDFFFDARPWLYFDEVNLLVDGEEVASLSGSSDFTEVGSEYRARFSGLDLVIREDDKAEVTLELVALAAMASDRDEDTVTVTTHADDMRFVDAAGISEEGGEVTSSAVTFSDTTDEGSLSGTVADNSPENATIVLNESSRTTVSSVLNVDVEAEDNDMEVTEVTVTFDTTGNTVAQTLYRARLYVGSTLLGTETVSASSTTFDDLEYMIEEDESAEFRVEVEFNDGEDLAASSTPQTFTVVSFAVTGENPNFDADTETVTVTEEHTILVTGLVAEIDSIPAVVKSNDDKNLKFTFVMDVTAYEDTFYINDDGLDFTVATSGTSAAVVTGIAVTSNATLTADDTYRISEGQTRSVTVEVFVESSTSGTVRVTLEDLEFFSNQAGDASAGTVILGSPDFRSGTENIVSNS